MMRSSNIKCEEHNEVNVKCEPSDIDMMISPSKQFRQMFEGVDYTENKNGIIRNLKIVS
jgi:hypothetical protein